MFRRRFDPTIAKMRGFTMVYSGFSGSAAAEVFRQDHRALTFRLFLQQLGLNAADVTKETPIRGKPPLIWLEEEYPLDPREFRRLHKKCARDARIELLGRCD